MTTNGSNGRNRIPIAPKSFGPKCLKQYVIQKHAPYYPYELLHAARTTTNLAAYLEELESHPAKEWKF